MHGKTTKQHQYPFVLVPVYQEIQIYAFETGLEQKQFQKIYQVSGTKKLTSRNANNIYIKTKIS